MKYRLLNNYSINVAQLMIKLAISAGIAGILILDCQPGQAVNEFSDSKTSPVSLTKADLLKSILHKHQKSLPKATFQDKILTSQSLPLNDLGSSEKASVTKVPKKISTVASTLEAKNDFSKTKILIQSNLNRNRTEAIPELPTLEIAQNLSDKKQPKQIHTVRVGETLTSIARKYNISDRELIQANNITNPHRIDVNDRLILPENISHSNPTDSTQLVESSSLDPSNSDNTNIVNNSAVPRLRLQRISTDSVESKSSPNSDLDPYINKLRADIVELRTQYQNQVTDNTAKSSLTPTELTYNSESDELLATSSNKNDSSSPGESVSVVSVDNDNNEILKLSSINPTTPDLPGLSAPEEYLPGNSFNGYIWPAKGTFTSGFGWRWGKMHKGIDIAAPIGTPIIAAASGEVISAGWNSGGYGNLVKVKHSDGSVTLYAHNNRIYVRRGQKIRQGEQIAEMGSTGYSTGPHLHFEIRPNGSVAVNPIAYLSSKRK